MFNVCPACGMYSVEKQVFPVDDRRANAVCPHCGYAHPFLRLPMMFVTGASGAGKSTLGLVMTARDTSCVHLESDILWSPAFNQPEEDYRAYRNLWLRVAKNIAQAGKPVVLYGSVVPSQIEPCEEARYFHSFHYLAVTCDADRIAERLRARPSWRGAGADEFIHRMVEFNQWLIDQSRSPGSPISQLDTTFISIEQAAGALQAWIQGCLAGKPKGTNG